MRNTTTTQKAAGASNTNGLTTHTNGADFRTGGAINQAHSGNAIANQVAHLQLAGHAVHTGTRGDFTVCKYGMTRYCQNFTELQTFAKQLGIKQ
jgi:hypothetical protein